MLKYNYILTEAINMAVPEEIRKVERPVNTVVVDSKRNGPKRFAVHARKLTKYVRGGNPQPSNGAVIGHIIGGRFVPAAKKCEEASEVKAFGGAALSWSVSQDLLSDLYRCYDASEAREILAIALLRATRKGVTDRRLSAKYRETYVSEFLPNVGISKNTVSSLIGKLGMNYSKIVAFMRLRTARVSADHHVAIDGMLKQDSSDTNDLSNYSFKSRVRGCDEVSVLYAYDIEEREPICCKVYPGNMIDAVSYRSFISENNIEKGLIIDDKGFPFRCAEKEFEARPQLGFLTPLRRNDRRIAKHGMLSFSGRIKTDEAYVLCRKEGIGSGRYLYSFKDPHTASKEEADYLRRLGGGFSEEDYGKRKDGFGTIVFESNMDLPPEVVYKAYADRWLIELTFRQYKSVLMLDKTRAQENTSVIGTEFIDFLSTVVTGRMMRRMEEAKLLDEGSYGDVLDDLNSALKIKKEGGFVFSAMNPRLIDMLERLGLKKPEAAPREKRKRGRPRKNVSPASDHV